MSGGIHFSHMYPRPHRWAERIKCFFLGHMTDYMLMDIREATKFWNFSKYRWTVGYCSRCGIHWADWDRFPYGQPRRDKDGNVT